MLEEHLAEETPRIWIRAVRDLRSAIDVKVPDPVASTNEPRRLDTFVVSYTDAQPDRAQRVANRLGKVFVDENSKTRAARAEDTTAFMSEQLEASQARINDLDTRLRKAKEAFMGQLPEQTPANLSTLSGLRQQIVADSTASRAERDRLALIDRQLDAIDKNTVDEPGSLGKADAAPETRVTTIERELAAARATYTDQHPEVQRLQDELANAKRDAVAVRTQPVADRMARLQRNPAYLQLQGEREMARARITDLERDTAETQGSIARYQARVEAAPMVEQQLKDLQLGYDLEKQQYTELSNKRRAAIMVANVERERSGERFDVLDAATLAARAHHAPAHARLAGLDPRRPDPRRGPHARQRVLRFRHPRRTRSPRRVRPADSRQHRPPAGVTRFQSHQRRYGNEPHAKHSGQGRARRRGAPHPSASQPYVRRPDVDGRTGCPASYHLRRRRSAAHAGALGEPGPPRSARSSWRALPMRKPPGSIAACARASSRPIRARR